MNWFQNYVTKKSQNRPKNPIEMKKKYRNFEI